MMRNPLKDRPWRLDDQYFLHVTDDGRERAVEGGPQWKDKTLVVRIHQIGRKSIVEVTETFRIVVLARPGAEEERITVRPRGAGWVHVETPWDQLPRFMRQRDWEIVA